MMQRLLKKAQSAVRIPDGSPTAWARSGRGRRRSELCDVSLPLHPSPNDVRIPWRILYAHTVCTYCTSEHREWWLMIRTRYAVTRGSSDVYSICGMDWACGEGVNHEVNPMLND